MWFFGSSVNTMIILVSNHASANQKLAKEPGVPVHFSLNKGFQPNFILMNIFVPLFISMSMPPTGGICLLQAHGAVAKRWQKKVHSFHFIHLWLGAFEQSNVFSFFFWRPLQPLTLSPCRSCAHGSGSGSAIATPQRLHRNLIIISVIEAAEPREKGESERTFSHRRALSPLSIPS